MSETRKIAAILVADVVGYSRLGGAEEVRTLSRLRGLRSDLIDPAIAAHHGRIIKRTGDGSLIEFRSVSTLCAAYAQPVFPHQGSTGYPRLFAAKHDRTANFLLFPSIFRDHQ